MKIGRRQQAVGNSKKAKVFGFALSVILLAPYPSAQAQQPNKIPRIGYVSGIGDANNPGPQINAFRRGLEELGYIEGENILVEYRYEGGKQDRSPSLVAELVQLKVDLLVLVPSPAIRAAKRATKTIPIVMVTSADPVATGLINSLAHPAGDFTGLTRLTRDLNGKRLELFKEAVPPTSRFGVLFEKDSTSGSTHFKEYELAARALKIPLQSLEVRRRDFTGAFQTASKARLNALITIDNALTLFHRKQIADLAIKNLLPSMYETSDYVDAGGLMSYAASDANLFRRAAVFVDKILKGAKPADLPVEQPTKFELIINLKAAKQIGLTIPPNVLARADRVIR
jgi:putative ABC transport system substrate-binding protein